MFSEILSNSLERMLRSRACASAPHRIAPARGLSVAALVLQTACVLAASPEEPAPALEGEVAVGVEREAPAEERDAPVTDASESEEVLSPKSSEEPEMDVPAWSTSTLAALSLREKVGQMIMPIVLGAYTPEGSLAHERVVEWVEQQGIGGVIVSVGTPTDVAVKLNDLQRHARIPLLVAADLETGAGFRLKGAVHSPTNIALGGATDFPSLMALGAATSPRLAYEMGRITAIEARAVGIHVPFAPVLDVNSNPDNPIINVRSFGEDPEAVATLGAALVRGIKDNGAIATGKHFPGHGDTETDSHLELPVIRATRERLDQVELVPFQRAIDAGMGGIMTAHISVPSLSGGNGDPATLSGRVLTNLLREDMGFGGLLFTDAMDMGAIDRRFPRGEAAVRAVEAGADVILMPPNVGAAVEALVNAVTGGRISEERIDVSVRRILEAKEHMGLAERPTVEIDQVFQHVGVPAHVQVAEEIARRSMTLLKNERGLLPLRGTRTARVLSVSYRSQNDLLAGRYFDGRLRSVYPRLTTASVHRDTDASVYDGLLRQARGSNLVVVSLYVTVVSYSGSVALPETVADFIEQLAEARVPHVVVSFGNPYLLREFPDAQAYLLAWGGAEVSQQAAVGALLGEFDLTGRTPTRIPPGYEIGDGILLGQRAGGR